MTDMPANVEAIEERLNAAYLEWEQFDSGSVAKLIVEYRKLQRVACLMLSYADGEISEGRAAELIGVDRLTLREMKIAALDRALEILNREAKPRAANL